MADLTWVLIDPVTGYREAFSSAEHLVQAAMRRCRRDGARWPVRRG